MAEQTTHSDIEAGSGRRWILPVAAWLLLAAIAGLYTSYFVRTQLIDDTRAEAAGTLEIYAAGLDRVLDKYRLLTPLLIQDTEFSRLLYGPADRAAVDETRRALSRIAAMSRAVEIRLFSADGRLLVTSQGESDLRLGDDNLDHLEHAKQGRLGRAIKVTPDGQSHYLFAAALLDKGELRGLIDLRFALDEIEQNWALSIIPVLATDIDAERGTETVILSNDPALHGMVLQKDLRYRIFDSLDGRFSRRINQGTALVRDNDTGKSWMVADREMPVLGWRVMTLHDIAPVDQDAFLSGAFVFMLLTLMGGVVWNLRERDRRRRMAWRLEQENARKLEQMVEARTAELRHAQAELIQAAKLAGLGRMSAAISHEFNQPLGAIRMFSENAELMMDNQKPDGAKNNLARIRQIVDRMAELSKSLKTFARKPGTESHPVALTPVINDVLTMLSPRLRHHGAAIVVDDALPDVTVLAGQVRLEQVLVNLLSNALDAMDAMPDGKVSISWQAQQGQLHLTVQDNGPGIAPDMLDNLFDPFMTSKGPGEGLGLGLSIAYNIMRDFNGDLRAANAVEGGAVFTMILPLADSVAEEYRESVHG